MAEGQPHHEREWEQLDDRELDYAIGAYQRNIELLHSLGPLDTAPALAALLEETRGKLQPLLDERAYRREHNIVVRCEYETPRESIESMQYLATAADDSALRGGLIEYQERRERWRGYLAAARRMRDTGKELGLLGYREDAHMYIARFGRELATLDAIIDVLEEEIVRRTEG